jgi:hypothetical protein
MSDESQAAPLPEPGSPPVTITPGDPNKISYAVVGVDGFNLLVDYRLGDATVQLRLPYQGDKEGLPKYLSKMVVLTGLANLPPRPRPDTVDLAQFVSVAGTVQYEPEPEVAPPPTLAQVQPAPAKT